MAVVVESVGDRMVYACLSMIGLGFLLPWNVLVTAVDYLNDLFPDAHVEFKIALAYMITNAVTMTLWFYRVSFSSSGQSPVSGAVAVDSDGLDASVSKSSRCSPLAALSNVYVRLSLGFLILLSVLVITPSVSSVGGVVAMAGLTGIGDATVQLSAFGFAGCLPPVYIAAVVSGNGWSGVLTAVLRIFTKLAFSSSGSGLTAGAHFFFYLSAAIIVLCVVCVWYLSRSSFVRQHYTQEHSTEALELRSVTSHSDDVSLQHAVLDTGRRSCSKPTRSSGDTSVAACPEVKQAASGTQTALQSNEDTEATYFPSSQAQSAGDGDSAGNDDHRRSADGRHQTQAHQLLRSRVSKAGQPAHTLADFKLVLSAMRWYIASIFWVFVVTLALFPGVTGELQSQYGIGDWFNVILVSEFMVFDYLGRSCIAWTNVAWFSSGKTAFSWAVCRTIFVPLLLSSLFSQRGSFLPFMGDDIVIYIVTGAFAFSNGYIASVAMMFGPAQVDTEYKELAGSMMALSLVIGLPVGAALGMVVEVLL